MCGKHNKKVSVDYAKVRLLGSAPCHFALDALFYFSLCFDRSSI